jgi:hypothetical protein
MALINVLANQNEDAECLLLQALGLTEHDTAFWTEAVENLKEMDRLEQEDE